MDRLEDLSPLKILQRGYAAVFVREDKVVREPEDVRIGELVRIQLAKGELHGFHSSRRYEASKGALCRRAFFRGSLPTNRSSRNDSRK